MAGFTSSNINYGDFYSGAMQPPVIANGLPTQSAVGPRPSGIADLYGSAGGSHPVEGALSLNGDSGLTSHSVHTVPVDMYGNPVQSATQAIEAAVPHASGTIDNSKLAYRATPDMRQTPPSPFRTAPAPTPPASIPDMFGSAFMVNGWGHQAYPMGDPGVPTNVTGDNGLFGVPPQGFADQPNPIPNLYAPPPPPKAKVPKSVTAKAKSKKTQSTNLSGSGNRYTGAVATNSNGHSYAVLANPGDRALQRLFTGT